jgi:hypothetical protein
MLANVQTATDAIRMPRRKDKEEASRNDRTVSPDRSPGPDSV